MDKTVTIEGWIGESDEPKVGSSGVRNGLFEKVGCNNEVGEGKGVSDGSGNPVVEVKNGGDVGKPGYWQFVKLILHSINNDIKKIIICIL